MGELDSLLNSDQKPPLLHVFSVNENTHMCQFVLVSSDPLDQLGESGRSEALAISIHVSWSEF